MGISFKHNCCACFMPIPAHRITTIGLRLIGDRFFSALTLSPSLWSLTLASEMHKQHQDNQVN
ncbi:MAG: hypothetical protein F6K16_31105 [Symploca sp. SIO2B6]|nr:hypothetical protein [Symploca sp. SIO2B6]